jgi:translation elongation factor EF-G
MDREGASMDKAIESMQTKLRAHVLPIHVPLGVSKDFTGAIDIVDMQAITFAGSDGEVVSCAPVEATHAQYAEVIAARELLFSRLADADTQFFEVRLCYRSSVTRTKESTWLFSVKWSYCCMRL